MAYILTTSADIGAPEPILTLAPRSSEAASINHGVFYPEDPAQLIEAGFEWLTHENQGDIRWESSGRIAAEYGLKYELFGIEEIAGVQLMLCVVDTVGFALHA